MLSHEAMSTLLLALTLIIVGAKVGGDIAQRFSQPAVLGELLAGVLMGNLNLLGIDSLHFVATDPIVDALAQLGVIVLLFQVGLESTLAQMARVGSSAMLVAILGVIAPMLLGFGVGQVFCPITPPMCIFFWGPP